MKNGSNHPLNKKKLQAMIIIAWSFCYKEIGWSAYFPSGCFF